MISLLVLRLEITVWLNNGRYHPGKNNKED